ncbi:hypothetical protein [Crossiella sp. NPDC003009]
MTNGASGPTATASAEDMSGVLTAAAEDLRGLAEDLDEIAGGLGGDLSLDEHNERCMKIEIAMRELLRTKEKLAPISSAFGIARDAAEGEQ